MKTNFLQTGDYHCFICHKTTPNGCAHLTVATNEFPTTPCVEACGKYYHKEEAICQCEFHKLMYQCPLFKKK